VPQPLPRVVLALPAQARSSDTSTATPIPQARQAQQTASTLSSNKTKLSEIPLYMLIAIT